MNWKSIVGIIIGAAFLYFAVRRVDAHEVRQALAGANYWYIGLIVILNIVCMWIRSLRWQYLLRRSKNIPVYHVFQINIIGFMANNILPARIGELVRAYVLGAKEGLSKTFVLATIVLERFLDFASIVLLAVLVYIVMYGVNRAGMQFPLFFSRQSMVIMLGIVLGSIMALAAVRWRAAQLVAVVEKLTNWCSPRLSAKIKSFLEAFLEGLNTVRTWRDTAIIVFYSLLFWLVSVAAFGLSMTAVHVTALPWYTPFILTFLVALGVIIPAAPGFIGTIQYCTVLGLGWFGISQGLAITVSLIYHLSQYVPIVIVGLYYYWKLQIHFSDIKKPEGQ
jgi:glycosyltransferase 2 family protein